MKFNTDVASICSKMSQITTALTWRGKINFLISFILTLSFASRTKFYIRYFVVDHNVGEDYVGKDLVHFR